MQSLFDADEAENYPPVMWWQHARSLKVSRAGLTVTVTVTSIDVRRSHILR